jgi:hypothetical protein
MRLYRILAATSIGSALALVCGSANAQTSTGMGAPFGTSIAGAPGTAGTSYGATVPPGLSGSVATPGLGYSTTDAPWGVGYVSVPSTTTLPASGASPSFTPGFGYNAYGYSGVGGTAGSTGASATFGTATIPAVGSFSSLGQPAVTIDGYGSGLVARGFAATPGTTEGGGTFGQGTTLPGAAYGSGIGAPTYIGQPYGFPGLFF